MAVDEELLDKNPVPGFIKKLKLRAPKRGKAPFEDSELERLWTAYKSYEPVYGHVSRFSAETGARLGELVALEWPNVDLSGGRVYIEHTWDDEAGPVAPKDNEPRWLYLTPHAVKVLEAWVAIVGAHVPRGRCSRTRWAAAGSLLAKCSVALGTRWRMREW